MTFAQCCTFCLFVIAVFTAISVRLVLPNDNPAADETFDMTEA